MELYRKVKTSERLPKVPGYYFALDKKGHQTEWQYEGNYIIGAGAGIDWWLEPLPPQEPVTIRNLQDLLIKYGKSYQGGYKILAKDFKQVAQAIHKLYGEKGEHNVEQFSKGYEQGLDHGDTESF